jgi:hypothetical protein
MRPRDDVGRRGSDHVPPVDEEWPTSQVGSDRQEVIPMIRIIALSLVALSLAGPAVAWDGRSLEALHTDSGSIQAPLTPDPGAPDRG